MFLLGLIVSLALAIGFCVTRKLPLTTIVVAWPATFVILAVGYHVFLWALRISFFFACIAAVAMSIIALASAFYKIRTKSGANQ